MNTWLHFISRIRVFLQFLAHSAAYAKHFFFFFLQYENQGGLSSGNFAFHKKIINFCNWRFCFYVLKQKQTKYIHDNCVWGVFYEALISKLWYLVNDEIYLSVRYDRLQHFLWWISVIKYSIHKHSATIIQARNIKPEENCCTGSGNCSLIISLCS